MKCVGLKISKVVCSPDRTLTNIYVTERLTKMVTFDQRYNADMRGKYIPGRQTISAKPYGEITVKTERATAEAVREKMQQMNGYQVPVARL